MPVEPKRFLKFYLVFFIVSLIFNFIGHAFVLDQIDGPYLEGTRKPFEPSSYPPVLLAHVFLSFGIVFFIFSSKSVKNPKYAAFIAGLFAFISYLNVGLTNTFLLPHWPTFITIADATVSGICFGLGGSLAVWVFKRFKLEN